MGGFYCFRNISFKLISLIFLTSLVACSKAEPVKDYGVFAPYVEKFVQVASEQGRPVTIDQLQIRFGNAEEVKGRSQVAAAIAICTYYDDVPTIVVDQKWWDEKLPKLKESGSVAEQILFHEMGHCILKRHHVNEMDPIEQVPASIMYSKYIKGDVYEKRRASYYEELFRPEEGV
jgi:hypothetical protein